VLGTDCQRLGEGKGNILIGKEFRCPSKEVSVSLTTSYGFCNTKLTRGLPFARQQIRMKILELVLFCMFQIKVSQRIGVERQKLCVTIC